MAPLIVLVLAFTIFFVAGLLGAGLFAPWEAALRWALAVMFIFTGIAHFTRTRGHLVRMVPTWLPAPGLLVTITGILEIAGALLLLLPSTALWGALGLIAMLAAMFPANARAAREKLTIAGRAAMPLPARLALQLLWIGALWVAGPGSAWM